MPPRWPGRALSIVDRSGCLSAFLESFWIGPDARVGTSPVRVQTTGSLACCHLGKQMVPVNKLMGQSWFLGGVEFLRDGAAGTDKAYQLYPFPWRKLTEKNEMELLLTSYKKLIYTPDFCITPYVGVLSGDFFRLPCNGVTPDLGDPTPFVTTIKIINFYRLRKLN